MFQGQLQVYSIRKKETAIQTLRLNMFSLEYRFDVMHHGSGIHMWIAKITSWSHMTSMYPSKCEMQNVDLLVIYDPGSPWEIRFPSIMPYHIFVLQNWSVFSTRLLTTGTHLYYRHVHKCSRVPTKTAAMELMAPTPIVSPHWTKSPSLAGESGTSRWQWKDYYVKRICSLPCTSSETYT